MFPSTLCLRTVPVLDCITAQPSKDLKTSQELQFFIFLLILWFFFLTYVHKLVSQCFRMSALKLEHVQFTWTFLSLCCPEQNQSISIHSCVCTDCICTTPKKFVSHSVWTHIDTWCTLAAQPTQHSATTAAVAVYTVFDLPQCCETLTIQSSLLKWKLFILIWQLNLLWPFTFCLSVISPLPYSCHSDNAP